MSTLPSSTGPSAEVAAEALDWFVRRTGGGFGAREEHLFQAWLGTGASHRTAYGRLDAEWRALDALPADGLALLRANLTDDLAHDLSARVAEAPSGQRPMGSASLPRRGFAAGPASPARRRLLVPALSAGFAAAAAGMGFLGWNHWQAQPLYAQEFKTARGQQLDVALPDGSSLRLDTATRVEVAYFRQRREVKLPEGQAVFSVQPDPARPFDVLAGPLRITVVGTRFSVRHTPSMAADAGVRVAVEEGRVRVERIDPQMQGRSAPVFLGAGQQVQSDARGLLASVARVPGIGIAPWRDQRISFDDVRLDLVLAELARYGDTRLVARDPAVAALRVTGTFNPMRPDSFERVLPQAAPVRLQARGGVSEIVRAP